MQRIVIVLFLLLCWAYQPAWSDQEKDNITLNFSNSDIVSVIQAVGQITGKNFLIDPRVKGTINIVSSHPVDRASVYPILLAALRLQGYAAIPADGVIRIVPEIDAKSLASRQVGLQVSASGEMVTQVYPLKHQSANLMMTVLRPMISANSSMSVYPSSNTLVITDYSDNVKRLDRIIDAIDQPQKGATLVALHHASAIDVAQTLNKLYAENGSQTDPMQHLGVATDTRTNSLILDSISANLVDAASHLAERLDVQTGMADNFHVIFLKNARAADLANTLNAALGVGGTSHPASTAPDFGASGNAPGGNPPSTNGQNPVPGSTSPGMGNTSNNAGGSSLAFGKKTEIAASGGIVQADEATNSLVVVAAEPLYNAIRAIVSQLDERRAQIYVEALIAEIDINKAADFGLQWQTLNGVNSTTASMIGGTNFGSATGGSNIISAATNITSVGQGLNLGLIKGTTNLPGVGNILNLGVLASALATSGNANILSAPNLLTLDNESAKIIVGQNIPLITGSYAQTGTTTTISPFQTYNRQDVGLTLKIKPQISQGGSIQLQIYQEVSSVDATTLNNPSGPTTNLRSIDSTVLVDDGQIIVLGGLIQNSVSDNDSSVPVLGDIPVLGNLFHFRSRNQAKTELLVFLRPHVLRGADDARRITNERYNYVIGEQNKVQQPKDAILPSYSNPVLPAKPESAPVLQP